MAKTIRNTQTRQKAVKIFTDRIEPRQAFWDAYEDCKKTLNGEEPTAKVIAYYGMGGIGKSRLLTQLQEELGSRKDSYFVTIDFAIPEYNAMSGCFDHIWKVLKNKYRFSFPLYGAGLAQRAYLKQEGEKIDEDKFRSVLGGTADDIFDLVQQLEQLDGMPFIEFIPKLVRLTTKGVNHVLKERDKTKYKEELLKIQEKPTLQAIEQYLPYLLGQDIERNMDSREEPLVIFLDTYEQLVNELENVGYSYTKDDWLKGDDGLIVNTKKILWVIAGREKLKWEEHDSEWTGSLEQHLMDSISESDAVVYFKEAGIPESLHHGLYERTRGVPVFLDLSVDTYYQIKAINEEPTIDKFGNDKESIIDRYIRYMHPDQKLIMYTMAFLRRWPANDNSMFNLAAKDWETFDVLAKSSCIRNVDEMRILHEAVGEVLRKVCPKIQQQKICENLLAYFKEMISKIEQDALANSYLITTAFMVALDYYAPQEIFQFYNEAIAPEVNRLAEKGDLRLIEICRSICREAKSRLGENHLATLKLMNVLGTSLSEACFYEEAAELQEKVLEDCKHEFGQEHPTTIAAMSDLTRSYESLCRYEDALLLEKQIMEALNRMLGEEDPATIGAMNNVSVVLSGLGRHQEALDLQGKVVELFKRKYGEPHPDTIKAMGFLAQLLNELDRPQEALELQQKVLELSEHIGGGRNPISIFTKLEMEMNRAFMEDKEKP